MNDYKLHSTSDSMKGFLLLTYDNGSLLQVQFCLQAQLRQDQYEWIMRRLPQNESALKAEFEGSSKLSLQQIIEQPMETHEKLAMFYRFYGLHKHGTKFKATAIDAGKIKNLDLTPELLDFYFKSNHWMIREKQSIAHLAKYFNEIRALHNGLGWTRSVYPDHFDRKLESTLQPQERVKYHQHLIAIGWAPVKNQLKEITNWVAPKSK